MEDLYMQFTISISKLNKIIQKIKSFEIGRFGLQPIHVSCCYYLSKNPQGLTAKELSSLTLEDKAAISRALKTLNEKGLVEYVPRGRNEIVKLTDSGSKFAEVIGEKINEAVDAASMHITEKQRDFFYNSLLEISENLISYYNKLLENQEK